MLYYVSKGEMKMKGKKLTTLQAGLGVVVLTVGSLFSGCSQPHRPGDGVDGPCAPKQETEQERIEREQNQWREEHPGIKFVFDGNKAPEKSMA